MVAVVEINRAVVTFYPEVMKAFLGQYPEVGSCHPNPNDESLLRSQPQPRCYNIGKHPKGLSLQSAAVGTTGGYGIFSARRPS